MSDKLNAAIHSLLTGWWAHEDLRQQGASIAELNDSAVRLEGARSTMRNLY